MQAKIKPLILLTESKESCFHQELKRQLVSSRFEVAEAVGATDVLLAFSDRKPPAAVIIGPHPNGMPDDLTAVRQLRQRQPTVPIIMIAKQSSEEHVIAALRAKIDDYFKLPCCYTEIVASIRRLLQGFSYATAVAPAVHSETLPLLIGESPQMTYLREYLPKVAATDSNVLITGETGTGKELAARLIHHYSARREKPLIAINCAALPESLLESELFGYEAGAFTGATTHYEGKLRLADGGTVFFDEIGEMSLCAQAKILRAIETREIQCLGGRRSISVNFRIIAATNQALETLVTEYKFRKDLYFRLNVIRVQLPPLRERKEDIPLLFKHYLVELKQRFWHPIESLSQAVLECMFQYDWPGNVRELRNLAEALMVHATSANLSATDLPEPFQRLCSLAVAPAEERELLLSALHATRWNKSKAAEKLNWSRMTLYRKMAKYAIRRDPSEAALPNVPSEPL